MIRKLFKVMYDFMSYRLSYFLQGDRTEQSCNHAAFGTSPLVC